MAKKVNEIKLTGVLSEQQVTPTFKKQVLLIDSKDMKDNQWKQGSFEVYIKQDIMQQSGINIGDTVVITGWLTFNFWNGNSFPKVIVTEVARFEDNQQPQYQNNNQNQQYQNNNQGNNIPISDESIPF